MDLKELSLRRAVFVELASKQKDRMYTYDLYGLKDDVLYKLGVIFDTGENLDELMSYNTKRIPRNEQGLFGACIDMTKFPDNVIHKDILEVMEK